MKQDGTETPSKTSVCRESKEGGRENQRLIFDVEFKGETNSRVSVVCVSLALISAVGALRTTARRHQMETRTKSDSFYSISSLFPFCLTFASSQPFFRCDTHI